MDDIHIITSPQGFLHGFLLESENHEEFKELYAGLLDDHKPMGIVERHAVIHLAVSLWRLRRIRFFDPEAAVGFGDNDLINPDGFGRRRSAILKQLSRAIRLLKELQKDRPQRPRNGLVIPFPRANVKLERKPAGVRQRFRSTGPQDSSA